MEAGQDAPGRVEHIDVLRADSPMFQKTIEHAMGVSLGTTTILIPDADHVVAVTCGLCGKSCCIAIVT